jgi:hypothetical protein
VCVPSLRLITWNVVEMLSIEHLRLGEVVPLKGLMIDDFPP